MAQLALQEIRDRVSALLADSALQPSVRDVAVELPVGYTDDSVVRVIITVADPDKVDRREAAKVIRSIEVTIGESDERFASVRFAEAA